MSPAGARPGRWTGRLILWPERALYVGPSADNEAHAHHALQVCVGLDGPFELREPGGRRRRLGAALIRADTLHQLEARGPRLALLFVDPESPAGRRLHARFRDPIAPLDDGWLAAARAALATAGDTRQAAGQLAAGGDRLIDALAPGAAASAVEPRVARALARLHAAPGEAWSATALAGAAGLSLGRFAHLFRAATGVPVRRYILWTRLIAAVRAVSDGASLTTAAHAAGFADSAHLSRTFRRMFGIPPSALARGSTFVQALPAPPL